MKNSEHQLQLALADCLHPNLSGLNEKHAKKLQKTISKAVDKLARQFTKLQAKEHRHGKPAAPKPAAVAPKKAAPRAVKPAPQPAAKRATTTPRAPRRKPAAAPAGKMAVS